jgi:hypothetical protein
MGRIIRWKGKNDFDSTEFTWNRRAGGTRQPAGFAVSRPALVNASGRLTDLQNA